MVPDAWQRLDEAGRRAVTRWRSGERAHIGTADQVLTALGLHLRDLPEEAWLAPADLPARMRGRSRPANRPRELVGAP